MSETKQRRQMDKTKGKKKVGGGGEWKEGQSEKEGERRGEREEVQREEREVGGRVKRDRGKREWGVNEREGEEGQRE